MQVNHLLRRAGTGRLYIPLVKTQKMPGSLGYETTNPTRTWEFDESEQLLKVKYLLSEGLYKFVEKTPNEFLENTFKSFYLHYKVKAFNDNSITFIPILTDNSESSNKKLILKKE